MMGEGNPKLLVQNRQRGVRLDMAWIRRFARGALTACAGRFPKVGGTIGYVELDEVVVTVVSDARIDRLHREFMDIAGATDVITFEHGDIVVSADTAFREAQERGGTVEGELGLYIVHGLLHLNGFDDQSDDSRQEMHAVQDEVWRTIRV
jgi:probable rRNA maturation factor